jgi:hypothetical protein
VLYCTHAARLDRSVGCQFHDEVLLEACSIMFFACEPCAGLLVTVELVWNQYCIMLSNDSGLDDQVHVAVINGVCITDAIERIYTDPAVAQLDRHGCSIFHLEQKTVHFT